MAASMVSDDIHVVDSFSSDRTCAIVREFDANLRKHQFINYAVQRNWATQTLQLKHEWELHLDADEQLSDDLIVELRALSAGADTYKINGYYVPRLVRFLGRDIRHGGMFPIWHMRLFRHGKGQCENREYDQHFVVQGATGRLKGPIIDDIRMPLGEWISRHNRWADAEVRELLRTDISNREIAPRLFGSSIQRKRYFRTIYNSSPLFVRAVSLFIYRYVIRTGFLDGKEGAIFFMLQTLWYRFLVDAKLFELTLSQKAGDFGKVPDEVGFAEEMIRLRSKRGPESN